MYAIPRTRRAPRGVTFGHNPVYLKFAYTMYVLVMSRAITKEGAVLLESRLERVAQSWPLVQLSDVERVSHKSEWLTAPSTGLYVSYDGACDDIPHAELLQKYKLIAAGGCVVKRLLNLPRAMSDIDIFVVGTSTDDATARIFGFMRDVIATMPIQTYSISHSQHQITLIHDGDGITSSVVKFQFILRLYPSIAHILGGFDISISQVAYDGSCYWATKLGAWSIARQCVLVDVTRASPSFAYRIEKYRGLADIIFVGVKQSAYNDHVDAFTEALACYEQKGLEAHDQKFREYEDAIATHAQNAADEKVKELGLDGYAYVKMQFYFKKPLPPFVLSDVRTFLRRWNVVYTNPNDTLTYKPRLHVGDFHYYKDRNYTILSRRHVKSSSNKTHNADYASSISMYVIDKVNTSLLRACRHDLISTYLNCANVDPVTILTTAPQFSSYDASTYGYDPLPTIETLTKQLSKVEWITKNPGRQWTASFDPRPITGPAYYGAIYTGTINQSAVVMTMWLGWYKGPFGVFPRDIMKMLIIYTLRSIAAY